jgi:sporulation protein YabP
MENNKNSRPVSSTTMTTSTMTQKNHIIHMENRKKLDITGVRNVITFNDINVVLQTTLGMLNLKGKDMRVNKLNVENGDMSIEGEIISMIYTTKDDTAGKKRSLIAKLLK